MFDLTRRNNNHVNPYNPFREMDELEKAFFSNPFGNFFGSNSMAKLPGFDKKDITLDIILRSKKKTKRIK